MRSEGCRIGQKEKVSCDAAATRSQLMHRELQSAGGTLEPPQMEAFVAALISYLMSGLSREEHGLPVAASFSQGLLPDRVLTVNCQWPTLL